MGVLKHRGHCEIIFLETILAKRVKILKSIMEISLRFDLLTVNFAHFTLF